MKDAIFVRIPRTASRSVHDALEAAYRTEGTARLHASSRHPDARTLMTRPDWSQSYRFSFVRNPWDRLVSAYFFKQTEKFRWALQIFHQEGYVDDETVARYAAFWRRTPPFDEWVLTGFERFFLTARPQIDYLVDADGRIAVDFIGRFETLRDDVARLADTLGCAVTLGQHRNRTEHRPYTEYYTQRSLEHVTRVYQRDIDAFGYRFGQ